MNNAADLMAQTGSTTKELIVFLLPVGEFQFGVILALSVLTLILVTVALSFRSAL